MMTKLMYSKSTLLVAVVGAANLAQAQFTHHDYQREYFEQFAVGAISGQNGWTGNATIQQGFGSNTTKVLSLAVGSSASFTYRRFATEYDASTEFKLFRCVTDIYVPSSSQLGRGSIGGIAAFNSAGSSSPGGVMLRGDGTLFNSATGSTIASNLPSFTGRWITMAIDFNFETRRFTPWIRVDSTDTTLESVSFAPSFSGTKIGILSYATLGHNSTSRVYADEIVAMAVGTGPEPSNLLLGFGVFGMLVNRRKKS